MDTMTEGKCPISMLLLIKGLTKLNINVTIDILIL